MSFLICRQGNVSICLLAVKDVTGLAVDLEVISFLNGYFNRRIIQFDRVIKAVGIDDRIDMQMITFKLDAHDFIEGQGEPGCGSGKDRTDAFTGLGVVVLGTETWISF